jgi:hypothetical protein
MQPSLARRGLIRSAGVLLGASVLLGTPLVAAPALAAPPVTCPTDQGWVDTGAPVSSACLDIAGTAPAGQPIVQDLRKPYTPITGWTAVPVGTVPSGSGGTVASVDPSDNPDLPGQDQNNGPGMTGGFVGGSYGNYGECLVAGDLCTRH